MKVQHPEFENVTYIVDDQDEQSWLDAGWLKAAEQEPPAEVMVPAEPAGNASREEWAEYVVAAGLATDDDIADLSRDELRDTYKAA